MRTVLVIGGGASGLTAAISAARAGARTILLEHGKQVGKKILVTGNGRCNLTNEVQGNAYYRGGSPGFAEQVFGEFGLSQTLRFFEEIGVVTKSRRGYLYPYSDQAASVAEALRMEAEHRKVKLSLNTKIKEIIPEKNGFQVKTEGWTYRGDALILAAGSCAAPQTGSDGSGYLLAKRLGHRVVKPLPALVQLTSPDSYLGGLSGLRMDARVSLLEGERLVAEDLGEVQFTKNGLSGIPVFQVSRYAVRALEEKKKVRISLDLMPTFSAEEFRLLLEKRVKDNGYKNAQQLLVGLFPKKMGTCLLERAGIPKETPSEKLSERQKATFVKTCKEFSTDISGSKGFLEAQVCSGGVDTRQVQAPSMESKLVPGLYFAGEILDIDGACGGYNLQWAWSSGFLAGLHAAKERA